MAGHDISCTRISYSHISQDFILTLSLLQQYETVADLNSKKMVVRDPGQEKLKTNIQKARRSVPTVHYETTELEMKPRETKIETLRAATPVDGAILGKIFH